MIKTNDEREHLQSVKGNELHCDLYELDKDLRKMENSDITLKAGEFRQMLREYINDVSYNLIFE